MSDPVDFADAVKVRNEQLQSLMRLALQAMNEGRYGDARRILETGSDKPVMSRTGVIAKDGAA